MSNPRSSRRKCARVATFHVDDEIEISSSILQSDSLHDRVSGAGPPVLSLQGNADLAEVPGSIVCNEPYLPTFDTRSFEFAVIDDRALSSLDRWALELVGKRFKYEDHEFEGDQEFKMKHKHPSNLFVIHSLVVYSGEKKKFIPANVRYAKRNLHFIFYSLDDLNDYEITPVASFDANLLDRDKIFVIH